MHDDNSFVLGKHHDGDHDLSQCHEKSVFNNYFHDADDLPFRMIFMIIYDENCLVFNLPHASGLHNLLENRSLDRPQLPICHCLQLDRCHRFYYCHHHHHCCRHRHDDLDACCSLAVVEDRQLTKGFSNSEPDSLRL